MMDEYGLSRDDVFETMDEFCIGGKERERDKFGSLDSKDEAAFTRLYNAGVHKSQALVAEQGFGGKKKKTKVKAEPVEGEGGERVVVGWGCC
jgi:replication factor C subunit 1